MKRTVSLLLCLVLLVSITACQGGKYRDPGSFYYHRTEISYSSGDGVIAPEERELSGIRDDVGALLNAYLSGPKSDGLESPFPPDTRLLSWELQEDRLVLNFNSTLAALSGVELTIACACVARTFLELLPVEQVVISADGALLSGETCITLTKGSILYYDDGLDLLSQTYTVYYTDIQRRYLIGQEIELDLTAPEDLIPQLIGQMQDPPDNSGLYSAIPLFASVLGVTVEDGLCTVNFSQEFESNSWSKYNAQRLTLMAVVNTLTQLEEIDQVEFCVEGSLLAQYRMVNIPAALEQDADMIGPVRTGVNEFDATLYLDDGNGQYLVPIPTRIRQTTGISQAELVLRALIAYQPRNGLTSPLPSDTVVKQLTVEDGVCHVDLSGAFLSNTSHLPHSTRSIVGSICALDGIDSVMLTVEGIIPQGDLGQYFGLLTAETGWFA